MAAKRSRANFEADADLGHAPYVAYGTPLPSYDPAGRDDGSYVPLWKQEVTDDRGRKRLHGAFTGGFSAGYFNTVGSKEGWTPAAFVSSRSSRHKDTAGSGGNAAAVGQRPEDFMDDEDLADAAEAQKLRTADAFAGLGSTEAEVGRAGLLMDLARPNDDTIGVKLLQKMGWRPGQGIGPKVRRTARLESDAKEAGDGGGDEHWFAPENTAIVAFAPKVGHKGLGFTAETRLSASNGNATSHRARADGEAGTPADDWLGAGPTARKKSTSARGAFGVGVLNDTGSDDEDPYAIGPAISYSRVIGKEKKKKSKGSGAAITGRAMALPNPLLGSKPVFVSKKSTTAARAAGFRRCHDGRLPLDGFILSTGADPSQSSTGLDRHKPPEVPADWKSKKTALASSKASHPSVSEMAKASSLDPKSRASILGEAQLPGKSVFDFLTPAARDRLASASGNAKLPVGRGEGPPVGYAATAGERQKAFHQRVPKIASEVAVKALGRGLGGWMPYAEDEGKRGRYRAYLEVQAGLRADLPESEAAVSDEDRLKELAEFAQAAEIFKPMSGMMASRFTSSATPARLASDAPSRDSSEELLRAPSKKAEDPAEAAAKLGMFGPMTRSMQQFHPTRLVCKRFNVKAPSNVQSEAAEGDRPTPGDGPAGQAESTPVRTAPLISQTTLEHILMESGQARSVAESSGPAAPATEPVDASRNAALEGERAGEAVFKAVFGSDDEDDG